MTSSLGPKLLLSLGTCFGLALSVEVRADDLSEFDGPAIVGPALTEDAKFAAACIEAKFYLANLADLRACYGDAGAWDDLIVQGMRYAETVCSPAQADFPELAQAKARLAAEQSTLTQANAALAQLKKQVGELQAAEDEWRLSKEAGATQHTIDARKARETAQASLDEASKSVLLAQGDVSDAQNAVAKLKTERRAKAFGQFGAAIATAEKRSRSEADFEALLRDIPRRAACQRLYRAELAAFAGDDAPSKAAKSDATAAAEAGWADHATDILRKALGTSSAATTTTPIAENPGSPDRVSYAILTALGADAKTTGTQAVLTLNLSSLFWSKDEERLKQEAWKRNVFVRGAFPLTTTKLVPETGAGASSGDAAPEISRFSILLGGSLLDETDTLL
jgi:hypothetical protein